MVILNANRIAALETIALAPSVLVGVSEIEMHACSVSHVCY